VDKGSHITSEPQTPQDQPLGTYKFLVNSYDNLTDQIKATIDQVIDHLRETIKAAAAIKPEKTHE